jgi:hypothetical protein
MLERVGKCKRRESGKAHVRGIRKRAHVYFEKEARLEVQDSQKAVISTRVPWVPNALKG